MLKKTKCAVCGAENLVSDEMLVNPLIAPNSRGAKLYFDLWHFPIQQCSECGYSSLDISVVKSLNVAYLKSSEYSEIFRLLDAARPNMVEKYYDASRYYQLINDQKYQALCLLQAGDLVFNEIFYWKEYVLTEDENCPELYDLARTLYLKGVEALENYCQSTSDIDMELLLAGVLADSEEGIKLSNILLNKLSKSQLSDDQREILNFLISDNNF